MALFNSGDNEQKQRKKQAEKILDELVGGMMPTRTRIASVSYTHLTLPTTPEV